MKRLNKGITSSDISYGSHQALWWKCSNGHPPYQLAVKQRTTGKRGCPTCGNLSSVRNRSNPVGLFNGTKIIKKFDSISQAARFLKLANRTVINSIDRKKVFKGNLVLKRI